MLDGAGAGKAEPRPVSIFLAGRKRQGLLVSPTNRKALLRSSIITRQGWKPNGRDLGLGSRQPARTPDRTGHQSGQNFL